MRTANLLPWRQSRQRHCVRFWGLLFTGSLFLVLSLYLSGRASHFAFLPASQQWRDSNLTLKQALEQRKKQWLAMQNQRQQRQRWEQQKAATRDWQPVLITLSDTLPAQAWLTRLRFQQSTLYLTGFTSTPGALNRLERALEAFPGFLLKPAGEMRQDAQGRWQFSYALSKREANDAGPL
ncbi:PilN domain-containing protein [Leclercia sp. UBA2479]|uniref:PilN domain-containing protein n=1 Tax=Leclercia sp. UBA2479 TaxID=1946738 RepID=UPI00257971B4|nr:PilN domain-containing protein [Leclercia sp. UBA2479]